MTMPDLYPLHGGQLRQVAERFGIPARDLLDFSANINPSGPPPAVLKTLRASLDDLSTLTEYPDLEQAELKQAIAQYTKTHEENIIAANGFVPILEAVLRVLRIRTCLLPVPCFVEYRRTLERSGVQTIPVTLSADTDFHYDSAELIADHVDAILLANPQNPSGICHDAALLRDLVAHASTTNTYVLLDEAFIDYVPEHSLATMTDEFSNLIVFRSVTKFHGIPGLRVAYALANPILAASITEHLPPWPITTLASHAVIAALGDQAYATRSLHDNTANRTTLASSLRTLGLAVYPSAANFLLFRLPASVDSKAFWQRMIVDHRIVLRSCANYEGLSAGHFRTAVRTPEENERLVNSLAMT